MSLSELYTDDRQIIRVVKNGITKSDFTKIRNSTGLSAMYFATVTHVAARTIEKKKASDKLSSGTSERAILIGKLYHNGEKVFGDRQKFLHWMENPNFNLDGKSPKEMIDTLTGIELVNEILIRIQHGMVA
jgi:putative toxin-antitoxin system antitoxin component (TIGR02293 family)